MKAERLPPVDLLAALVSEEPRAALWKDRRFGVVEKRREEPVNLRERTLAVTWTAPLIPVAAEGIGRGVRTALVERRGWLRPAEEEKIEIAERIREVR